MLTFNIWNYSGGWRARRWRLLDAMVEANADLIALQEVRHNWADRPGWNQARWLAEHLSYHWVYRRANTFVPFGVVTEGLGFLSRERLEGWDWLRVPHSGRGPRRIVLRCRYGGYDVYNVHYPLSETARDRESRIIVESLSNTRPTLVMGDFNADAEQSPMQILFHAGLEDAWEIVGQEARTPPVWPQTRRIDYVLTK